MVKKHSKYDNIHKNKIIYPLKCTNNHIILSIKWHVIKMALSSSKMSHEQNFAPQTVPKIPAPLVEMALMPMKDKPTMTPSGAPSMSLKEIVPLKHKLSFKHIKV